MTDSTTWLFVILIALIELTALIGVIFVCCGKKRGDAHGSQSASTRTGTSTITARSDEQQRFDKFLTNLDETPTDQNIRLKGQKPECFSPMRSKKSVRSAKTQSAKNPASPKASSVKQLKSAQQQPSTIGGNKEPAAVRGQYMDIPPPAQEKSKKSQKTAKSSKQTLQAKSVKQNLLSTPKDTKSTIPMKTAHQTMGYAIFSETMVKKAAKDAKFHPEPMNKKDLPIEPVWRPPPPPSEEDDKKVAAGRRDYQTFFFVKENVMTPSLREKKAKFVSTDP